MKKLYTLIFAIVCLAAGTAGAQTDNPLTQYFQVPYLYNPGLAGIEDFMDIKAGARQQWTSFDDAPRNYFIGVNHSFGGNKVLERVSYKNGDAKPVTKVGLSGHLIQENFGPYRSLQTGLSYAVHVPVSSEFFLSLGLTTAYERLSADVQKLQVRDETDEYYQRLINSNGALNYFNTDAGIMLYSKNLYLGYSTLGLVRARVDNQFSTKEKSSVRHTVLVGYNYKLSEEIELIPTVLMRLESPLDPLYNFNAKVRYKGMVWTGLGYSPKESLSFFAGFTPNSRFNISYSYDVSLGQVKQYATGNHEVVLGITMFNSAGKKSFLF